MCDGSFSDDAVDDEEQHIRLFDVPLGAMALAESELLLSHRDICGFRFPFTPELCLFGTEEEICQSNGIRAGSSTTMTSFAVCSRNRISINSFSGAVMFV